MKRSLLSKLLAGVMSLGLVTGGSSIQNVYAMGEEWDEDNDDDLDDIEIDDGRENQLKRKKYNKNNMGISRFDRALSAGISCIPGMGPFFAHACLGTLNETLGTIVTAIPAGVVIVAAGGITLTVQEKEALALKKPYVTVNGKIKDADGNICEKDNIYIVLLPKKDVDALENSAIDKLAAAVRLGLGAYSTAWAIYDVIQFINQQ